MTDPTSTELEQAAIDAAHAAFIKEHYGLEATKWLEKFSAWKPRIAAAVRAIPLDYCVQRAINEGALVLHQRARSPRVIPGDTRFDLYRLASETETPQMHTSSCDSGPNHPGPCR